MPDHFETLLQAVAIRAEAMRAYLLNSAPAFAHPHLTDAILSYPKAGGKSLRSAVLLFACGAVGGDESQAIPAAAAVELYHTWTLVHDDIIDRDEQRRGVPTVHTQFAQIARDEMGFDDAEAAHYGLTIAILAGDLQQGWCTTLLTDLYRGYGVGADVTLNLIYTLFSGVQNTLVDGEALDVFYSSTPVEHLSADQILNMLWKKTGVLYDFAGRAGAAIGLGQPNLRHPEIERIAAYAGKCGIAFQIQDDILGAVGNADQLGKPVGADIREGKRTLVVLGSLPNMTPAERNLTLQTLGNADAAPQEIQVVIDIMRERGGVAYAEQLAQQYVQEALEGLRSLPQSSAKDLLVTWGQYLVERAF